MTTTDPKPRSSPATVKQLSAEEIATAQKYWLIGRTLTMSLRILSIIFGIIAVIALIVGGTFAMLAIIPIFFHPMVWVAAVLWIITGIIAIQLERKARIIYSAAGMPNPWDKNQA